MSENPCSLSFITLTTTTTSLLPDVDVANHIVDRNPAPAPV
jgi:hypothetical protein